MPRVVAGMTDTGGGGDVDDVAPLLGNHRLQGVLDAEENPFEVDGEEVLVVSTMRRGNPGDLRGYQGIWRPPLGRMIWPVRKSPVCETR